MSRTPGQIQPATDAVSMLASAFGLAMDNTTFTEEQVFSTMKVLTVMCTAQGQIQPAQAASGNFGFQGCGLKIPCRLETVSLIALWGHEPPIMSDRDRRLWGNSEGRF